MVRKIEYTVSESGIAPAVTQFGGVQGEHRATELLFSIDSALWAKLEGLVTNEGGKLIYRFDGYDGEGGVHRSDTASLVESASYLLEEQLTRYGGTVRVVLVVSLVKSDTTEMELYSFPAVLRLKGVPMGTESEDKNHESMTTLAEVAKSSAETAVKSAEAAVEAQGKTEQAKIALEGGTFWVFDGGNAKGEVDIDGDGVLDVTETDIRFVVDSEISDSSDNPIKNKVIKSYVDEISKTVLLAAHPIGSLYFSSEATEPSELFGGTWERVKDKFILAAGDKYKAGESGGESEVTLTEEQMPKHQHAVALSDNGTLDQASFNWVYNQTARLYAGTDLAQYAGGDQPHNNMPPYEVYYCWQRTG